MSAHDAMQRGFMESMNGTTGGCSHCGAKMPRRFSAQKKTEVVLRLLNAELP